VSKGTSALTDLINKNKKPADTTFSKCPTTKGSPRKAKEEVKPKQHLSLMVYLIKEKKW
jgi:hypothetical protein